RRLRQRWERACPSAPPPGKGKSAWGGRPVPSYANRRQIQSGFAGLAGGCAANLARAKSFCERSTGFRASSISLRIGKISPRVTSINSRVLVIRSRCSESIGPLHLFERFNGARLGQCRQRRLYERRGSALGSLQSGKIGELCTSDAYRASAAFSIISSRRNPARRPNIGSSARSIRRQRHAAPSPARLHHWEPPLNG